MVRTKLYAAALFGVAVALAGVVLGATGGLYGLRLALPGRHADHPGQAAVTATPDPLWMASAALDDVLDQYPGSVPTGHVSTDWHATGQSVERQATYQTSDPLAAVQRWYAERLHVSPDSDVYVTGGDGCAFLSNTQPVLRAQYTVSVLVCAVPGSTTVTVTETLLRAE